MAAYCCLCLEDLNDVDGDGAGVEAAPCGHVFHKTCIRRALAAKKKCPSCRDSCTAGQLIKLFVDYRDTASDHAGPSAPDVIETDLVDDGDTKRQTSQLKESLAGLQRRCTVLEAQRDRAAGASEEMREQHTTLTEENYILRDQLRKNEETRRMYSIEKSGMKHKLDQGERSLQQAHDRNAKLMDEKKDLEGKIALSRLSDESISEADTVLCSDGILQDDKASTNGDPIPGPLTGTQEIVELHTNLLKVVDHKKILLEQARNIVRLNKSNGGLIEQVKGLAFAKGELDRKSRAYKQLQASYLQLQSELARLQEARQQEAYGDAKVANRDIRVWHGATENGP